MYLSIASWQIFLRYVKLSKHDARRIRCKLINALNQMGPFHILLDEMGLDQMGLDQMGLDKVGRPL